MAELLDHDLSATFRIRDVSRSFQRARAEENPFTSMCRKGTAPRHSKIEWPFKSLHAPEDSAIIDGVDVQAAELINNEANKSMLEGRIQKGRVATKVGDIAETTGHEYGVDGSLYADNKADCIVKARENMELTSLKDGDSVAGSGVAAGKTRGLAHWIKNAAQADLPVPAAARTPAANLLLNQANASDITEDEIRGVMRSIATTRRKKGVWDLFCTPAMKEVFSNFIATGTQSATALPLRRFTADQKDAEIKLDVQFYTGDFGRLRLHTHFSLPATVHFLAVDMQMAHLRIARRPRWKDLEDRGGGPIGFCDYLFALCCDNPQAHGRATSAAS